MQPRVEKGSFTRVVWKRIEMFIRKKVSIDVAKDLMKRNMDFVSRTDDINNCKRKMKPILSCKYYILTYLYFR